MASDAWQDLLEERAHAAADDATCRHEAADQAFTALLEPLRTFEEENRDLIEQRRAGWAEIEERASRTADPVTR